MKYNYYYYQFFVQYNQDAFNSNLQFFQNLNPAFEQQVIYYDNSIFIIKAHSYDYTTKKNIIKYTIGYLKTKVGSNLMAQTICNKLSMNNKDIAKLKSNLEETLPKLNSPVGKKNIWDFFSPTYLFKPILP